MEAHPLLRGKEREILALVKRQRPIFEEDLWDSIPDSTKDRVYALIKFLSDATLPITNRTISKKLEKYDNLFELKPKNTRIFYFMYGKNMIISCACKKGNKKDNEQDMKRADKLRKEFISEN